MTLNSPPPARRTVSLTAVIVVAVLVAAVAVGATAAYFVLHPSTPPSNLPPGTKTVNLTDDLGRREAVPVNATRVVVLAPSILDSMFRLGLRAHVVGVDCYNGNLSSDYNASQIAQWGLTTSLCVDVTPAVDVEDLLNKTPELILASTLNPIAGLEDASSTYGISLVFLAPSTIGGIEEDVSLLGAMFNVPVQADALIGEMQQVLALAQNISANLTNSYASLPTVLLTYYPAPAGSPDSGYYTYGPTTFGESLVELASGVSISANSTVPYPELSGDQVLLANPQFVIYGTGFGLGLSSYQQGPDWSELPAVQNHSAYGMDSNFVTEADPTMILVGLPQLLAILHPSFFAG